MLFFIKANKGRGVSISHCTSNAYTQDEKFWWETQKLKYDIFSSIFMSSSFNAHSILQNDKNRQWGNVLIFLGQYFSYFRLIYPRAYCTCQFSCVFYRFQLFCMAIKQRAEAIVTLILEQTTQLVAPTRSAKIPQYHPHIFDICIPHFEFSIPQNWGLNITHFAVTLRTSSSPFCNEHQINFLSFALIFPTINFNPGKNQACMRATEWENTREITLKVKKSCREGYDIII